MRRRLEADSGGERGFVLIEVVISAVVVLIVGLSILDGLDGSLATASKNRSRSVAAGLVEQDQERMRSFKATDLSNYQSSRVVTVAGAPFTVTSSALWVRDSSGTVSCTNDSTQADYLKISSTATPASSKQGAPVTADSLVAPPSGSFGPDQGSLSVLVVDRDGNPVPGLPVSLSGPASLSGTTSSAGCAVFGYIPQGTYQATVSAAGRVGIDGSPTINKSTGVTGGSNSLLTVEYDHPATIEASFDTKVGATVFPAASQAVTVANPKLPSPGVKTVVAQPAPARDAPNRLTVSGLYPFTGGYGVYAGSCAANDPTQAPTSDPNYYVNNPGLVMEDPGGSYSVTVREPAINVVVKDRNNQLVPNARIVIIQTDSGCTTDTNEQLTYEQPTNAVGSLDFPGFPFGTYSVCADGNGYTASRLGVLNTDPAGTPVQALNLASRGKCA